MIRFTSSRQRVETRYGDGRVVIFNPILTWMIYPDSGLYEIGIGPWYAIGILLGTRVGVWSRYRTKYLEFKHFTIYLHLGQVPPYNPRTGEQY